MFSCQTFFLEEMSKSYAEVSALASVALQAAMFMPSLLLQKPHPKSKAKELRVHLNRRLKAIDEWGHY